MASEIDVITSKDCNSANVYATTNDNKISKQILVKEFKSFEVLQKQFREKLSGNIHLENHIFFMQRFTIVAIQTNSQSMTTDSIKIQNFFFLKTSFNNRYISSRNDLSNTPEIYAKKTRTKKNIDRFLICHVDFLSKF